MKNNLNKKTDIFFRMLHNNKNGVVKYSGDSTSMFPQIKPSELVEIVSPILNNIIPGEVVVFQKHENYIAHRVIYRKNFVLKTKGDNNNYFDAPISLYDVAGIIKDKYSYKQVLYGRFRNLLIHTARIKNINKLLKRSMQS